MLLRLMVSFGFVVFGYIGVSLGQFAGGLGTSGNPYQIENCTHFQNINDYDNPSSGLQYFLLMNDIDCTGSGNSIMIGGDRLVANLAKLYLDGDGHMISYDIDFPLYGEDNTSNVGLFRSLTGSTIINLIASGQVVGYNKVGGIIGNATYSTIENSSFEGSVDGNQRIGGVVGNMEDSTIDTFSFLGNVNGNDYVGGLIGEGIIVDINSSHGSGVILGSADYVGGLVGAGTDTYIYSSYNTSTISGNDYVGGLLGMTISFGSYTANRGILDSYNAGDVSGNNRVGGLIGWSHAQSHLKNCYNVGDISGSSQVGGIVGHNGVFSTIENCYNVGVVTGSATIGGIYGFAGSFSNNASFWDILGGLNPAEGSVGSGLDTDIMKDINTFITAGRDISGISGDVINNGYPFLGREYGLNESMRYISVILGCMDSDATNYSELATQDDGSCTYINSLPPSRGGGGLVLVMDNCPNGDFSGSYYDDTCLPNLAITEKTIQNLINQRSTQSSEKIHQTLATLIVLNDKIQAMESVSAEMKKLFQAIIDGLKAHYNK